MTHLDKETLLKRLKEAQALNVLVSMPIEEGNGERLVFLTTLFQRDKNDSLDALKRDVLTFTQSLLDQAPYEKTIPNAPAYAYWLMDTESGEESRVDMEVDLSESLNPSGIYSLANAIKGFEQLKDHPELCEVMIEYSGSNDSGDGFQVATYDPFNERLDLPSALRESFESMGYVLLDHYFPGWEINEGSAGLMSFNLKTGAVNIQHDSYHMDFIHKDAQFDLKQFNPPLVDSIKKANSKLSVEYELDDMRNVCVFSVQADGKELNENIEDAIGNGLAEQLYKVLEKVVEDRLLGKDEAYANGELNIDVKTDKVYVNHRVPFRESQSLDVDTCIRLPSMRDQYVNDEPLQETGGLITPSF